MSALKWLAGLTIALSTTAGALQGCSSKKDSLAGDDGSNPTGGDDGGTSSGMTFGASSSGSFSSGGSSGGTGAAGYIFGTSYGGSGTWNATYQK